MPRSRRGSLRGRGASAPEYAIGAAVLAVVLLGGLQALEDAATEQYEEEQALVATPVTGGGSSPTTASGGTSTTQTLPPALTTTTSAPAGTTTTTAAPATTTSTTVGFVYSASATGQNQGQNHWRMTLTITASPTGTGSVSGSYRVNGTGSPVNWSCTFSGGTCVYSPNTNLTRDSVSSVVFSLTAASSTPNNLPITATATRPA